MTPVGAQAKMFKAYHIWYTQAFVYRRYRRYGTTVQGHVALADSFVPAIGSLSTGFLS